MFANFKSLDEEYIRSKIGTMYIGVCLSKGRIYGLSYSVVFLLRRTAFVMITFLLYDYPSFQTQVFIASSIVYIGYFSSNRIYEQKLTYRHEYLNELLLLNICYHQLAFTNILDSPV